MGMVDGSDVEETLARARRAVAATVEPFAAHAVARLTTPVEVVASWLTARMNEAVRLDRERPDGPLTLYVETTDYAANPDDLELHASVASNPPPWSVDDERMDVFAGYAGEWVEDLVESLRLTGLESTTAIFRDHSWGDDGAFEVFNMVRLEVCWLLGEAHASMDNALRLVATYHGGNHFVEWDSVAGER